MSHLKEEKGSWIVPTLATIAFLALLTHKSEFPSVFNRYSINYTMLLTLAAINLCLSWRLSVLRVSYRQLMKRFLGRPLVSVAILILSVAFVIDLMIGIPHAQKPSDWVNLALGMGILIQAEGLRRELGQLSGHLALCACSLTLAVILLELILVRFLLESRTPKSESEFLRLMASHWSQPISVQKPAGRFRILGLSDSFGTWGGTSNYHYLLEDILHSHVSPTIQMVNVSLSGYEPAHQLAILRFGMPYSPDLVLHGFFVGNDFNLFGGNMYRFRGIQIWPRPDVPRYRPRHFLIRDWIEAALEHFQEHRERRRELITGIVDELAPYSKSRFLKLQFERMNTWGGKWCEKDVDRQKILPILDDIRSTAEAGGARYVMIIHPDETQVNEALRREIIATFQVDEREYDFDLPQRVLRSYCADREIPCLDLLPIFRAKAKHGDLYLLRDAHYNHAGNKLAAVSISQFLRDEQLLPSTSRSTPR